MAEYREPRHSGYCLLYHTWIQGDPIESPDTTLITYRGIGLDEQTGIGYLTYPTYAVYPTRYTL